MEKRKPRKGEVRYRVRGILQEIYFELGRLVDEGALLYSIEDDSYEASDAAALADLASIEADVEEGINALTLSPALCGLILRKPEAPKFVGFRLFNWGSDFSTRGYRWTVDRLIRSSVLVLTVYIGLVAWTFWAFGRIPTGFVPDEDQGYVFVNAQLPDAASKQRTEAVMRQLDAGDRQVPGIAREENTQSGLMAVNSTFRASVPQIYVEVDRTKAKTMGIPLDAIFGTMQAYLGSVYINDFHYNNRLYQVRAQADAKFRAILMTSLSGVLGFLPLAIVSRAGAASRRAVGNVVIGGMLAATVFSLLFVGAFFVIFRSLSERRNRLKDSLQNSEGEEESVAASDS